MKGAGWHPSPGDLLDLHFGEAEGRRRKKLEVHVAGCARCGEELASVDWVDRSLAALPDEEPPADGLERVLARVDERRAVRVAGDRWLAPFAATVAGVAAGAGAIYLGGTWLIASTTAAARPAVESVGAASGFGLAALAFFGIGSFVTLALAPALLMEAQSRRRALAGR